MWPSSPTEAHHPPSCCARVTARPARPRTEPSPTCRAGPPSALRNCAPCCAATNCCPPRRRWKSSARCRTATCSLRSARRRIALDTVLPRRAPPRRRDLALALIVARLLEPAAKLATARMLDPATASHSLGEMLGLGKVAAKEVYAALDWLGREQPFIEAQLARRHLKDGALLLYDVTSTYLEGRCCELAQHGYSRDHRGDRPQLVIGLMCAAEGCPVAVEVFEGNTADPLTLSTQIDKLKQRFRLQRVVMVGDRGVLTSARIEQTLRPAGLDWITALRAPAIKQLAAAGGPLQRSLFDDRDMAEITSPDYPGERLVVCKNPLLAEERARKRAELLRSEERRVGRE